MKKSKANIVYMFVADDDAVACVSCTVSNKIIRVYSLTTSVCMLSFVTCQQKNTEQPSFITS